MKTATKQAIRWISIGILAARIISILPSLPPGPDPGPGPNPPTPINPDWPTPSAELQAAVAPIKAVMQAADRTKAAAWAGAWEEYLMTFMDRPGLPSTGALKAEIAEEINAAGQELGLAGAFPGFSTAFDAAFTSYFGPEDGPLDWNRAKEFVSAIVWTCQ